MAPKEATDDQTTLGDWQHCAAQSVDGEQAMLRTVTWEEAQPWCNFVVLRPRGLPCAPTPWERKDDPTGTFTTVARAASSLSGLPAVYGSSSSSMIGHPLLLTTPVFGRAATSRLK
jgi:hypothetical protein